MELWVIGKGVTSMPRKNKEQEVEVKVIGVLGEICRFVSQQFTIKPAFKGEVCSCFSK